LLDLISKHSHSHSSKKEKRKFLDLLIRPKPEDLDPREPLESENSMEFKKFKGKKLSPAHVPSLKSTQSEEPSKAKRTPMLPTGIKLPKFRD